MHLSLGLAQPQASRLSGSWPQPSACRPEQAVLAHSQLTTQPCRLCPFAIQHDELVVCGWLRTRTEEQLAGTTAVPLAVRGSRHGRTRVVLCVCGISNNKQSGQFSLTRRTTQKANLCCADLSGNLSRLNPYLPQGTVQKRHSCGLFSCHLWLDGSAFST